MNVCELSGIAGRALATCAWLQCMAVTSRHTSFLMTRQGSGLYCNKKQPQFNTTLVTTNTGARTRSHWVQIVARTRETEAGVILKDIDLGRHWLLVRLVDARSSIQNCSYELECSRKPSPQARTHAIPTIISKFQYLFMVPNVLSHFSLFAVVHRLLSS